MTSPPFPHALRMSGAGDHAETQRHGERFSLCLCVRRAGSSSAVVVAAYRTITQPYMLAWVKCRETAQITR